MARKVVLRLSEDSASQRQFVMVDSMSHERGEKHTNLKMLTNSTYLVAHHFMSKVPGKTYLAWPKETRVIDFVGQHHAFEKSRINFSLGRKRSERSIPAIVAPLSFPVVGQMVLKDISPGGFAVVAWKIAVVCSFVRSFIRLRVSSVCSLYALSIA